MKKDLTKKDQFIAGLDIGSSKVVLIVGQPTEHGIDVIGVGSAPCQGLRKGFVVNIEATTEAINKAREEAELMSGVRLEKICLGVSGANLNSVDSKGIVAIRDNEVTSHDVQRVIEAAKTIAVPDDRQVLHVLPRAYKIDDQDGISDPIGMSGVRLEANVHILTGGHSAIQNMVKCTERAGLKADDIVLQVLASARSVLTEDEKNLGVALVDIGGSTSDIIIYVNGTVAFASSLPIGGAHITNDVAVGLRTPPANAENLKKKYGCALASLVNSDETIEVEGVGGRKERIVQRNYLCEVIEPRAEEILNFINSEIQKSGFAPLLGSGIVLTGGGSSMDGFSELGEFVFDLPVRRGLPKSFGGLVEAVNQPMFATAVGLLQNAHQKIIAQNILESQNKKADRWLSRFKDIIDGAF